MTEVLMGHQPPPIDNGVMTLMEVASAYLARAYMIQAGIHELETDGQVTRGDLLYRIRTGELRDFIELARGAVELGSRRVTAAKMEYDQTSSDID